MTKVPAWIVGVTLGCSVAACGLSGAPPTFKTQVDPGGYGEGMQKPPEAGETEAEPSIEDIKKVEKAEEAEEAAEAENEGESAGAVGEAEAKPAGGADRETSALMTVDPCTFATPDQMKTWIQSKLTSIFPKKYKKYTFLPKAINIKCPSARLDINASVKREIRLLPDLKGKIDLSAPLTAKVDAGATPESVKDVSLCMGKVAMKKIDFKYVPSFLESGLRSVVNGVFNKVLPGNVCADVKVVKAAVVAKVAKGGKLTAAAPVAGVTKAKKTAAVGSDK